MKTAVKLLIAVLILAGTGVEVGCGDRAAPPGKDAGLSAPTNAQHPKTGMGLSPQGGTVTSVLPSSGGGLSGGGSAGALTLGLLTSCGSGQGLIYSGSAWACGASGGTDPANLPHEAFITLGSSTYNDLDLWSGGTHYSRVEVDLSGANPIITGIVAGVEGDFLYLWNGGGASSPDVITLVNGSTSSAHNNRIWLANGKTLNIANNDGVLLIYDHNFGWTVFGGGTSSLRANQLSLEASVSPTALTGGTSTNNYNPWGSGGVTSFVRQDATGGGVAALTGLVAPGAPNSAGRVVTFANISTTTVIAFTCLDTNSTSDNEFTCPGGSPFQLSHGDTATFIYDGSVNTWRVLALGTVGNSTDMPLPAVLATDPSTPFNDWHPTGLGQYKTLPFQAGDNHGNLVTGIDAIGANIPIGYKLEICNTDAPQDDGTIGFSPEDTRSTANNRIWTPGWGRNTAQSNSDRFVIGASECATFRYMQPDQTDATFKRWVINGPVTRQTQTVIKQLGLFPYSEPAAITGTVNNWAGDDTCPAVAGPLGGSCEASSDVRFESYTVVIAQTVDSTGAILTGMQYAPNGQQNQAGMGPVKLIFNFGPGPLTLVNNSGASSAGNIFQISGVGGNAADIVLQSGQGMMFYHLPAVGGWIPMHHEDYYFGGRDVTITKGLYVTGPDPGISFVAGATMAIDQVTTGKGSGNENLYIRDVGSYNTTSAGLGATGLIVAQDATRSAGGNNLTNVALLLDASNGQVNYALQTTGGNVYFGLGAQMAIFYDNTALFDVSGVTKLGGNFQVGGDDFNGGGVSFSVNRSTGAIALGSAASSAISFLGSAATTLDMNGHKILDVTTPTNGSDAANKAYVDSALASVGSYSGSGTSGSGVRWTGTNSFGNASFADTGSVLSSTNAVDFSAATSTKIGNFIGTTTTITTSGTLIDLNIGNAETVYLNPSSATNLGGIAGGVDGKHVKICAISGTAYPTIIGEWSTETTAANRIVMDVSNSAGQWQIIQNSCVDLVYVGGSVTRWLLNREINFPWLTVSGTTTLGVVNAGNIASNGFGDFSGGVYAGGPTDSVYLYAGGLGFFYGSASTQTGYINNVGAAQGTTQFRNLEIDDGEGSAGGTFAVNGSHYIERLDGATRQATFYNQPVGATGAYAGTHWEVADEMMYGIVNGNTNAQLGLWAMFTNGTGASYASSYDGGPGNTGRPGQLSLAYTSSTAAGGYSLMQGTTSVDFADASWTFEASVDWVTLSGTVAATSSTYRSTVGFNDAPTTGNASNGCYFAYDPANSLTSGVDSGNAQALECWCAAGGTRHGFLINASGNSDNSFPLGTGTVAAATYYRLAIKMTGTTKAEFYRNGTKVCEIATNVPASASNLTVPAISIVTQQATTTASRNMLVDQTRLAFDLNSVRSP